LAFVDENILEQVLDAVGRQFANTNGPDFEKLTTLPALVLLETEQVMKLMGAVRDGIVGGISGVVYDLRMEEKYQNAAMRAL
jgi:hypothetical protein